MKKLSTYILVGVIICGFHFSCSSGGGGDDDMSSPDPDPIAIDPPSAAALVFPEQNSECTTGSNLTSTESTIVFNWNDASNATSYQLFVKNLNTQNTQNYTSNVSEKSVTIMRGTPYSWYVISKNSSTETAQSPTWKFYNAGEAVSSYAPFPAELISPALSETLDATTTSVVLEWNGADVENDIKEYDVFFGTENSPTNKEVTTNSTNTSVSVSSGNTYYWKIITYDEQNHNSESQVFQFHIE
ncbi:hypothetical protein [Hyunsoonleella pacifica]|uniref:Fibronectin type-III domain-containing protein n=1 Tax=Hyunsoonleella pacifica TaxID=1080224 RepID=A0A4Q9FKX9_9FLAO|nr:hypothetical protein [Hyunsoonleella pacifica]TBN14535.1 hypothetical protein EYD46_13260 [Hyunsoonleella pacifica]GGD14595.1 hypothetical protein GCM10011368_15660 [Hyunsoonleella pacifica]